MKRLVTYVRGRKISFHVTERMYRSLLRRFSSKLPIPRCVLCKDAEGRVGWGCLDTCRLGIAMQKADPDYQSFTPCLDIPDCRRADKALTQLGDARTCTPRQRRAITSFRNRIIKAAERGEKEKAKT